MLPLLCSVRPRLEALRPQLAGASYVVLTSADGVLARLATDACGTSGRRRDCVPTEMCNGG
jgi:hypothetical protein